MYAALDTERGKTPLYHMVYDHLLNDSTSAHIVNLTHENHMELACPSITK